MISSVHAEIAGRRYDTGFHVTNPNEWMLQKFLNQAVEAGDEYMVLEVTSHGIDQFRIWGIDFEVGVLTNVTHEHLDYHKNYENYLRAKMRFLKQAGVTVVNKDDESFVQLDFNSLNNQRITYAIHQVADVTPKKFPYFSPLPGEYNEYNCLAAIAACQQLGIADPDIKKALKTFTGVKGRFEYFPTHKNFDVIIDFAHTPNAIEKVLSTIKPTVGGKLIHVFGTAGLRDHLKRPTMGEKSARFSDLIVLTEEDYRTENVDEIIDQIAQGILKAGGVEMQKTDYETAHQIEKVIFFRIPDRQEAINFVIKKLARPGDTIILTGKAHEKSLARGRIEYSWSEHEVVRKALSQRGK
jgi:UDP-N-acetylmuramoyl-L-alanyl-D-glutamate--2,6-diaminopimelate ligase